MIAGDLTVDGIALAQLPRGEFHCLWGADVPPAADIFAVMAGINALLDESIAAEAFRIREVPEGVAHRRRGIIDISAIDFDALANRFKTLLALLAWRAPG